MTAHDKFFQKRKAAAVLKHAVLREYFTVFLTMVGSMTPSKPLWILDGYAGPGLYAADADGQQVSGSPVVALEISEAARSRKPSLDVHCIFIESEKPLADELRTNIKPFQQQGIDATVLDGEVSERLSDAWALVAGAPVMTLLDPFGVSMPRSMLVDPLLSRKTPPSEVLVNLNVEAISRIGGVLQRDDDGIAQVRKDLLPLGGQAGVQKVDDFFGGTGWRSIFLDSRNATDSATDAAIAVVDAYRKGIEQETGTKSIAIPIRRRQGQPVLFLFTLFFTHPAAAYKFCDAASRGTRQWRDAFRAEDLADFFAQDDAQAMIPGFDDHIRTRSEEDAKAAEQQIRDSAIDTIAANIQRLLKASPQIPVGERILDILGDAVALGGESHLKKAWDRLAAAGMIHPRNTSTKRLWAELIVRR